MKIDDSFVNVEGGQVFVRQWGDAGATAPIVLLHDSLGSVELWRDFPAALASASQRRVIAYDRLGFGKSTARQEAPGNDFIHAEASRHFPALMQALGLQRQVLFGHSVGGGMALAAAAVPGNGCVAVITESAQAFVEEQTLVGIRAAKAGFAEAASFARLQKWHGERARWVLDAWTETWLSPAFRGWSLDASLAAVKCPLLAIHGDADEFGSAAFPRRIVEGAAGFSRMELLAGCGHVPHREQPERVLALVQDFLCQQVMD